MLKRFLLILTLTTCLSLPVYADDLGPSNSSGTGSDAGALNALQPASPTSLQSADAQSGGINLNQPSTTNQLQPAGDKAATAQFLQGEASGAPQGTQPAPAESKSPLTGLLLGLVALALIFSSVMINRISKHYEEPEPPADNPAIDTPTEPSDQSDPSQPDASSDSEVETTIPDQVAEADTKPPAI